MKNSLKLKTITLLDAFITNKEEIIKTFYLNEYSKTKYYVLKNGGNLDNAKDIYQEAFFACWKKLSTGKFVPQSLTEIEAYLFTIAKNKWIDQIRKFKNKPTIALDDKIHQQSINDHITTNEENEKKESQLTIALAAFEELGQSCKDLLIQFYFHKKPIKEIAKSLAIQEASAKNKKYRCIQKLKELAKNKEI
ncbi:MAG TPA: sigma-70 family RNA polymerase sigma factor [Edaphocola sp.]|nr:sigma-70 family RNA polymerase sigma factor [Edaphocola sp.]